MEGIDEQIFKDAREQARQNWLRAWEKTFLPALCYRLIEAGIPPEQVAAIRPHLDFSEALITAAFGGMAGGYLTAQIILAQMASTLEADDEKTMQALGRDLFRPLSETFRQMAAQVAQPD